LEPKLSAQDRANTAALLGIGGIRPIDAEQFEQAKAETDVSHTFNNPLMLALSARGFRDRRLVTLATDAPFAFMIMTPYTRAASIAVQAKRKFAAATFPTLDALNAELVVVSVDPGSSILSVDTIENVVIKRGTDLIRPVKSSVEPTVVQNAMGLKKDTARGSFTFDFAAFAPGSAITLVLIGKGGNFEFEMTQEEVARLK
jgi:hypothetical protein